METTLWRLRRLQSRLDREGCILAILGADGRDNASSLALLRWLVLGESIDSDFSSISPLSSDYTTLEETVLLIKRDSISILYDFKASEHLAPLLRCPIARTEYVLPLGTTDTDQIEDAKMHLFACMVKNQQSIGIGLPRGEEDAVEEIEFWPLVQSYALETNTDTPGGFFSQHFKIFDATKIIRSCLKRPDATSLCKTLGRGFSALEQNCNHACTLIAQNKVDEACDALRSLVEYENDNQSLKDFVLSASAAAEHLGNWRLPDEYKTTSTTTDKTYIFQALEPASGLALCRTYLNGDTETTQRYLSLIVALHTAWPRTLKRLGVEASENELVSELKKRLLLSLGRGVTAHDLAVLVYKNEQTVYVRVALALDENATCVAVGDTFLLIVPNDEPKQLPIAQGECGLLTGDRGGSPYVRPIPNANLTRIVRDDPRSIGLNAPLMQMPGAALYAIASTKNSTSSVLYCGRLHLFQNGFVIIDRTGSVVTVNTDQLKALAPGFPLSADEDRFVLEMEFSNNESWPSLPCGMGTVQAAALILKRNSEAHRVVRDLLPKWRAALREHSEQTLYSDQREYEQACGKVTLSDQLDRSIQLLGGNSIDILPSITTQLPQAMHDSLDILARSDRQSCLRELDAIPLSALEKNNKNRAVYFILGVPGSGCEELAASLVRRGSWTLIQARMTKNELDIEATCIALKAVCNANDDSSILISGSCGAIAIAHLIQRLKHCPIELAGGAVVASCAQLDQTEHVFEGQFWPPSLWEQCIPGLTTALVIVKDGPSQKSKLLERRARAQAKTPGPRLIEVYRGDDSGISNLADAFLRPDETPPLLTTAAISARSHLAFEKMFSKSSAVVTRVELLFDLDYNLLLKLLTGVILSEKCTVHARTVALSSTVSTDSEDKPALQTLFSLAKAKVQAKQLSASRLAGLDFEVDAWRRAYPQVADHLRDSIAGLCGFISVEIEGTKVKTGMAIDGNSKALSLWPHVISDNKPYLLFLGNSQSPSVAALGDLLALAASRRIRPRPHRALENLTPQDIDSVLNAKSSQQKPLPSGWAFDGNLYVDCFGNRSKRRPDANEILSNWIQEQNSSIDSENRRLAL